MDVESEYVLLVKLFGRDEILVVVRVCVCDPVNMYSAEPQITNSTAGVMPKCTRHGGARCKLVRKIRSFAMSLQRSE